jgi:5-methylcytosine-specific restriction protein A
MIGYDHRRWRKRAKRQLREQPLCVMCMAEGQAVAATVADHVTPHKGDEWAFWMGPLQSLCKSHHDRAKRSEEIRGYTKAIGADGFPRDPRHPAFTPRRGVIGKL